MQSEKIPELRIYHSWVYDDHHYKLMGKEYTSEQNEEGEEYAKDIRKFWSKLNDNVFISIEKYSGLKWKRPIYEAFVVNFRCMPFSHPLTISMYYLDGSKVSMENFAGMLIHELVHQLVDDNYTKLNYSAARKLCPANAKECTWAHLFVTAVEWLVKTDLFGKKKAECLFKWYDELEDYKLAKDIVFREGPENIIKKCVKK